MKDFNYYTPTKVVFGKDSVPQTGRLVKEFGGTKVLVHFGGGSVQRSGLLDRILNSLTEAGVEYVLLGGVKPNPRVSLVREGAELCRREGVDFILAVGGGSVIDSCKGIGYMLANGCDVWDLVTGAQKVRGCAPVGAVLTIAAAGSEMSDSMVLTREEDGLKRGLSSDYSRCRFVVMDPQLTYTLPDYQTMSGATDIMMHTMERWFTVEEGQTLTDYLAVGVLRTVVECMRTLANDSTNYEARANLMWASSLSHNGLTGCGGNKGDWAAHQLEHELGGMFDVAHGAGLAAVWGSWARYVKGTKPQRFAEFGARVFDMPLTGDVDADSESAIICFEELMREIGMPTSIHELGVDPTPEQIDELAVKCTFFGKRMIGNFMKLGEEDIKEIYRKAL